MSMRTVRNPIVFVSAVIAIGVLLYSPLCSLSCAASDCSVLPKSKVAKQKGQSSHCHQHQDSEEQSTESHQDTKDSEEQSTESHQETNAPEPQRDSGDCPTHTDAIAILSSAIKAPTVLQQNVQPIIAALPETFDFSFDGFAFKSAGSRHFRSPPKRAVISVYRI